MVWLFELLPAAAGTEFVGCAVFFCSWAEVRLEETDAAALRLFLSACPEEPICELFEGAGRYGLVEFVVAIDAEEECTEGVDVEAPADGAEALTQNEGVAVDDGQTTLAPPSTPPPREDGGAGAAERSLGADLSAIIDEELAGRRASDREEEDLEAMRSELGCGRVRWGRDCQTPPQAPAR